MSIKRYGADGGIGTGGQHLPFARAVEADGWLYVSGQVPMVEGELIAGNIRLSPNRRFATYCRSSTKQAMGRSTSYVAAYGLKIRATSPSFNTGIQRTLRQSSTCPGMRRLQYGRRLQSGDRLRRLQACGCMKV